MKIRIKFRKFGNVRFIGHLDVQRFFQKAVRRAGIDVAYTAGFSPHQIMSFASPLGVGLESNGEYMDMEVHTFMGSAETVKRLNEVSAEGIEILSAKVLPDTAGNAMASVAAAAYTVRFREDREPSFDWRKNLRSFYEKDSILFTKVNKKNKKGKSPDQSTGLALEIDLKQGIYELSLQDDGIFMLLDASSAGNIKPGMVLEAYLAEHGETLKENALLITREDTYTNTGTKETPCFVPLDEIGEECEQYG